MMTDVVPSPTSSSCARLSSIMLFAAGCDTSTSRKIALPSFVMTMPPMGSRSILSIERGPSVVRTMSDTACSRSKAHVRTSASFKRQTQSDPQWSTEVVDARRRTLAASMLPSCAVLPVSRRVFVSAAHACAGTTSQFNEPPTARTHPTHRHKKHMCVCAYVLCTDVLSTITGACIIVIGSWQEVWTSVGSWRSRGSSLWLREEATLVTKVTEVTQRVTPVTTCVDHIKDYRIRHL